LRLVTGYAQAAVALLLDADEHPLPRRRLTKTPHIPEPIYTNRVSGGLELVKRRVDSQVTSAGRRLISKENKDVPGALKMLMDIACAQPATE
jgi:hypothetical protein